MALTEDEIPWAAAAMLLKRHGADAPRKVAERIGALAVEGDRLGLAAWTEIARCMDAMLHEQRH